MPSNRPSTSGRTQEAYSSALGAPPTSAPKIASNPKPSERSSDSMRIWGRGRAERGGLEQGERRRARSHWIDRLHNEVSCPCSHAPAAGRQRPPGLSPRSTTPHPCLPSCRGGPPARPPACPPARLFALAPHVQQLLAALLALRLTHWAHVQRDADGLPLLGPCRAGAGAAGVAAAGSAAAGRRALQAAAPGGVQRVDPT
jgi:hypothetical protein